MWLRDWNLSQTRRGWESWDWETNQCPWRSKGRGYRRWARTFPEVLSDRAMSTSWITGGSNRTSKTTFYSEGDRALVQVTHKSCGVSILGDIPKLSDPGDPVWAVGWDKKASAFGSVIPGAVCKGLSCREKWVEMGTQERTSAPLWAPKYASQAAKPDAEGQALLWWTSLQGKGSLTPSTATTPMWFCLLKTTPEIENSTLNHQLYSTGKARFTAPRISLGFWCNGPANANTRALILFWQEEQEHWVKSSQKNRQNCNSPMDKTNLFFQAACSSMVWFKWNPTIANIFRCLYKQKDEASFCHPGTAQLIMESVV